MLSVLLYAVVLCVFAAPTLSAQLSSHPRFWLRSDSGIVVTDGSISRWSDRSGNGYAAWQDAIDRRPALVPEVVAGHPAVRFDGLDDFLEGTPIFPVRSDYTLTFVVRINDLSAANNVVSGNRHAHWFGATAYARVLHGDFMAQIVSTTPVMPSELTIVTMIYLEKAERASVYINGVLGDSAWVGPNVDPTLYLGACAGANLLNGDLAEIILYDRELSDQQRKQNENYLFARYGIAPPPEDHCIACFSQVPQPLQFYARDTSDSAVVPIAGKIVSTGYDSIFVEIYRNGVPWQRTAQALDYTDGSATFDLKPRIHSELSEYRFDIWLTGKAGDTLVAMRDSVVCGDVFLIDGQSNSILGNNRGESCEYARTFGRNASRALRDTVWALARASGCGEGPDVGAWGLRMQKLLIERTGVPICIINGGVSGTRIERHQRLDSRPEERRTIYGSMLYRARRSGLAARAKGLFWYQGESNSIAGYYDSFRMLYEDWKSDYPALEKIYVIQIRPGCAAAEHSELRELIRTLPDSLSDVVAFSSMGVPGHDGCHYSAEGYDTLGSQISRLVARDFYGSTDTIGISSPNIRRAYFTDAARTNLALVFDNVSDGLRITSDTILSGVAATVRDAFVIDGCSALVNSARVEGDTIYLTLSEPYRPSETAQNAAATISYVQDKFYPGTAVVYEGPWITSRRGVGAFSFHGFPIDPGTGIADVAREVRRMKPGVTAAPNPFSTSTRLSITLPANGPVEITVVDGSGVVMLRRNIEGRTGENHVEIDAASLSSGVYLCIARYSDVSATLGFVLRK